MKYYCISVLLVSLCQQHLSAEATIIAFFRYEKPFVNLEAEILREKIEKPGKISRWGLKQLLAIPLSTLGIIGAYAGYCAVSNTIGQLTFPRKHAKDELMVLITQKIKPVIIRGQTVRNFIITPGASAQWYLFTREPADASITVPSWTVKQYTHAESERIPADALIIFAKPEDISVPTSPIATIGGTSLLLPTLLVTKQYRVEPNALQFLKVAKYFAPVKHSYRYLPNRFATNI
jgi:hypothetical protein